jgi:hypothetical protein
MKYNILFLTGIVTFLSTSCTDDQQNHLVGSWKAHWETDFDNSRRSFNTNDLKMDGTMCFYENGDVDISAFGYQGCIFTNDTLHNTLRWIINNDIVHMIDGDDAYEMVYNITDFSADRLQLTLLDDIKLTLIRN